MQCPKCKFEQPTSDTCTNCGIIFSRYKEAQERNKEVAKDIRPSPPVQKNIGSDILLYSMCAIFLSVVLARSIFFIEFPVFLDPYFRLLMLGAMVWLSFGIVPRAAALFNRLDEENNKGAEHSGLDGFNLYDKKAIVIFSAFGLAFFSHLVWSLLTGSIECFAGRNRTCHEIYDSIADPGEFLVTVLVYYIIGLIPTIVAFMGVQERRDRVKS
jgi:hypothetical protein